MEIINTLMNPITTLISIVVGPLLTWFFITKPYQKKELKAKDIEINSSHVNVITQNLDVYQRMFTDLDEQLVKANNKIKELEKEVEQITIRYKELKTKYELSLKK